MSESSPISVLSKIFSGCEGLIEIRPLPPGKFPARFFSSVSEAEQYAHSLDGKVSVYFGAGTRLRQRGTKDDVQEIPGLWADLDTEESVENLKAFTFRPTIEIETSPGRMQAWWLFKEPMLIEGETTIATIEAVLRGIADVLHADPAVCEVARVMRVPGTMNIKRKARGRLLRDDGPRYDLADFIEAGICCDPRTVSDTGDPQPRRDTAAIMAGVPDGTRDTSLFKLACKLRRADVPQAIAERLVLEAAANCTPPQPPDEARAKVANAYGRYPAGPDMSSGSEPVKTSLPVAVNLYTVPPVLPEFTVERFIRRRGLHVFWAAPGVGKTYTLLRIVHELMAPTRPTRLLGHPKLEINHRYRRVLWLGCEEDAGTLRAKADMVLRGLDCESLSGELMFLWAADPKTPITLLYLREILEAQGPFDAVVVDTLTGLLPAELAGEKIKWDADNAAVTTMCLMLRGIAATHNVDLLLNHHTGRDTSKGYRGPTAWWGAADMLIGFTPNDGGGMSVLVEKCRDGARAAPFLLTPIWGPDGFKVTYEGAALTLKLSPTAAAVNAILNERGVETQAGLIKASGCSRSSVQAALAYLCRVKLARPTGIAVGRSPQYESIAPAEGTEPGEAAPGEYDARNAMTATTEESSSARSAR